MIRDSEALFMYLSDISRSSSKVYICIQLRILNLQYCGHLIQRTDSLEKDSDDGKDWKQEEKGMTEDETTGWHHRLDGHEFEQAPGVGDG